MANAEAAEFEWTLQEGERERSAGNKAWEAPPASGSTAQVLSGADCFTFAGKGVDFSVEFKEGARVINKGSWVSRLCATPAPTSAPPPTYVLSRPNAACLLRPRSSMRSIPARRPSSSGSFTGVVRGADAEGLPRRVSHRPTSPSTRGHPRRGSRRTRGCYARTLRPWRPTTRSTSSSTCATGPLRESGATVVSLCLATSAAAASGCSARVRERAALTLALAL